MILLALTAPALPREEYDVAILFVQPARRDSLVVCTLETRGLPDAPSRETLASGLPSALLVALHLLDASGEERAGSVAQIRIEPDLWEQNFVVRTPFLDRRAASMEELASLLRRLGPLPVAVLDRLRPDERLRIRIRLAVHPLAPAEILRVETLLARGPEDDDPDRKEVSVGLGSLLRWVFGGQREDEWVAEATSGFFTPASLEEPTE